MPVRLVMLLALLVPGLGGCVVGKVVGAAVDVTAAVAGAAIRTTGKVVKTTVDVVTPDGDDEDDKDKKRRKRRGDKDADSEDYADENGEYADPEYAADYDEEYDPEDDDAPGPDAAEGVPSVGDNQDGPDMN